MLEELLVNCSAKEPKRVLWKEIYENSKYRMLENFQREFSMSMQERDTFNESKQLAIEARSYIKTVKT